MEYFRGLVAAVKPRRPGAGAAEAPQERTTRRCRCQASSRSAVGTGGGFQLAQATGASLAVTKRPAAARMEAHASRPPGELLTPAQPLWLDIFASGQKLL
jgi:hypothetical protein